MIHSPGIYFGLHEEEYHADESLSTSGIKKLIQDPEEFWDQSSMNPGKPPQEAKDCLSRGTLWHCRLLEPENFHKKYAIAPYINSDVADGKEVLHTVDDMKEWLDQANVPYKKSMKKSEFERAVLEAHKLGYGDTEPYLFDFENQGFANNNAGKTVIWSEEIYNTMLQAEAAMNEHPYFSRVFEGGMSEVSIFWVDQESGLPMKARIDKLKPKVILDYKTIHVSRLKSTRKAALDAIKYEHYDIQTAVYTIAVANAVNMINDKTGIISGDVPGAFIDEFRQTAEKPFGFVFQKEDRPYTVRGLKVVRRGGDLFNVFGNGLHYMTQGIQLYQRYTEMYGRQRWVDPEGMTQIEDHEIYYG